MLRLEVDQQSNHTLGPALATWANTLVPLHLGGLPGECGLGLGAGKGEGCPGHQALRLRAGSPGLMRHKPLLQPGPIPPHPPRSEPWKRPPYNGCVRNLVLNQVSVTWPRTAGVQGAVGASGCPAT